METMVHGRISQRHPDISAEDVRHAWENPVDSALRMDCDSFPEEVRLGCDSSGRLLEMVGTMAEGGWLVYHAMTLPSAKTIRELERAKRRSD